MKMNYRINPLQHQPLPLQPKTIEKQPVKDKSFQSFLKEAQTEQPLKISKHAQKRLDERNIHINETEWTNIQAKMIEAKNKGITDSAIVLKDAILVASTKNNTIVTVMALGEEQIIATIKATFISKME